jgi:hypothetical protein
MLNKPVIPSAAMEPEFLQKVRDAYVRQEPTARRLAIASHNADLSPGYLDQALAMSPKPLRELLFDTLSYVPDDEPEPDDELEADYRAEAALLFLHGIAADYWTATAQEVEQARALIIARYGKDAFDMLEPEKSKPTLHLLNAKVPVLTDEDQRQYEILRRQLQKVDAVLHNEQSSPREKVRAIQHALAAVELVRPDLQVMWRVEFKELISTYRELAKRYWKQIAEAKHGNP